MNSNIIKISSILFTVFLPFFSSGELPIPDEIKKSAPANLQPYLFFNAIVNKVKTDYVEKVSDDKLVELAIAGLLSSLDPHSCYLNEKAFSAMKLHTDGEFGGLGIEIIMDNGLIKIISPIDDTPAYKLGLKSGDIITHIDGEFVYGMTSEEAVSKLRGKAGTSVTIKVKRPGKEIFELKIERAVIRALPVKLETCDKIAYIRIPVFDKNTATELNDLISKLMSDNKNKPDGIILDLRDNPGGLLDAAVDVAGTFLDGGEIVSIRGRDSSSEQKYKAKSKDKTSGLPLVILINNGTASAPEIVAGALQDNGRAIIVGTQSFGKGSVQRVVQLSEKTGLKLTIARYYTPKGNCVQAKGITPDVPVEYGTLVVDKEENLIREKDLKNSLKAQDETQEKPSKQKREEMEKSVMQKEKSDNKEPENIRKLTISERKEKDSQLARAFDIVKTISVLKSRNK